MSLAHSGSTEFTSCYISFMGKLTWLCHTFTNPNIQQNIRKITQKRPTIPHILFMVVFIILNNSYDSIYTAELLFCGRGRTKSSTLCCIFSAQVLLVAAVLSFLQAVPLDFTNVLEGFVPESIIRLWCETGEATEA